MRWCHRFDLRGVMWSWPEMVTRDELKQRMASLYHEAKASRASRRRCHEEIHALRPAFLALRDHARQLNQSRDRVLAALSAVDDALLQFSTALGSAPLRRHPLLALRRHAGTP